MSATMVPSPTTTIRSTSLYSTSSRRCSMITIVFFCSFWILSINAIAFFPVAGSRLASGSSNKRISTSSIITPAMETLCFCPPDISDGAWESNSFTSTVSATPSTLRNISSCAMQSFSSTKAISSATVRPINCPSVSCNTVPTILESPKIPSFFGSFPSILSVPVLSPSYEKGISPLIQFDNVDFPDPDGPIMRTFSPG